MEPKVLFILKFRDGYSDYGNHPYSYGTGKGLSSGLFNSAKFVVDMLLKSGVETKLVQVTDNNDIDREVHNFRPTHVIIEALWVVPEKFDVLQRLHPHVKWIIRGHSEIPFLANEGIAIKWITQYVHFKNVFIAANSESSLRDMRHVISASNPDWSERMVDEKVIYLPNYYPHWIRYEKPHHERVFLDVASFGAIRPLKNQLIQAVAAIRYAQLTGKQLRFHINATRNEQGGNNVLKNLRALFDATEYELVEHPWMPHHDFLKVLGRMDILLQVSFSETFNIVTADAVTMSVPVVTSPEITWVSSLVQAVPTSSRDIVDKMFIADDWRFRWFIKKLNFIGLRRYSEASRHRWLYYLLHR